MLTNDRIVLKILKNNRKKPLSAYDILDKFLRIKKIQPATVYRSLKNLIEQNLVHKINLTNKYIVRNEFPNENDVTTIVVCDKCNDYEEIVLNRYKMSLAYNILDLKKFSLDNFVVEIASVCKQCNK
tara:strand:+ start:183 stop:563 length:381 start_codon:yes stop_codon:yes gene_type:complete